MRFVVPVQNLQTLMSTDHREVISLFYISLYAIQLAWDSQPYPDRSKGYGGVSHKYVYIYQNLRAIRRARDEPRWCPELNYDLAADADADEPPSEFEAEELASWWKDYCVEHADDATKLSPPPDDDDDDDEAIATATRVPPRSGPSGGDRPATASEPW